MKKDQAPAIIPSSYAKFNARVHTVQRENGQFVALCADIDKSNPDCETIADLVDAYFGECAYLIYSSSRATAQNKKWRIIIPLAVVVSFAEWVQMLHAFYAYMEASGVAMDWSLARAAQPIFLPNVPPEQRNASGNPNFYKILIAEGDTVDGKSSLSLEWRDKQRQEREERDRQYKAANVQTCVRTNAGSPINDFNATVDLEDCLLSHGYEQSPYNTLDFRSPYQTSGSYATRIMTDEDGRQYFVSLSGSDAEQGLGAESTSGYRFGDAFDLHSHFNHAGDFEAALRNIEPQTLVDPMRVRTVVEQPAIPAMPAPFSGVMKEIVDSALASSFKPQLSIMTLSVLIAMASACGGRYSLPSGMRLNLYGLGVAGTGEGKDHPLQVSRIVAKRAGAILAGAAGSSQGIEDSLVSNAGILSTIDEISHVLAAINDSDSPTHLKSQAGAYLALYSASKALYTTRALANTPSRTIANPCLNLLGFSTPEGLGRALRLENVTDGLLGRMLMATAPGHVSVRRVKEEFSISTLAVQRSDEITFQRMPSEMPTADLKIVVSPDASARLDVLLLLFDTEKKEAESEQALLARSYEKVERIAGVLAVWDAPYNPIISQAHVNWAEAAVRSSNANVCKFVKGHLFADAVQADAGHVLVIIERILTGVIKPNTASDSIAIAQCLAPRTLTLRYSKLNKKNFDLAVEHLVALGEVESTQLKNPSDGVATGDRKLGVLHLVR